MPKGSKRVAARQAELSRRKKTRLAPPSSGSTSVMEPEPSAAGVPVAEAAVNAIPTENPTAMAEAMASPPKPIRQPAFAARRNLGQTVSAARKALPTSPYLMSDLKLIAALTLAMIIALVVLDIILR